MLFVGVDAHKATSQVTVVSSGGQILKRQRTPTSPEGFRKALGEFDQPLKAVLEASYSWGPTFDWLDDLCAEVVLAHPGKVRVIAESHIKTDKIDSEILAHLLRANLIPAAHAPSKELRALKRVLRQRVWVVRTRVSVKNRIRALLTQHSVELPNLKVLFCPSGMDWLRQVRLPASDGELFKEHLRCLAFLDSRVKATEKLIAKLSKGDPAVVWLRSLPGVGPFISVLIRWEVDNIARFASAKRFASYTGLVPSTHASGKRVMHGRLTKQGNRWLRWAFIEAVTPALKVSPQLSAFYQALKMRRGAKDARAATARKLAELTWTIWTEQRCYVKR